MKRIAVPKDPMTRKALTALKSAVAKVVEQHRREGRPLAVWQNGKAVLVSPGKPAVVRETPANYRIRPPWQEDLIALTVECCGLTQPCRGAA